MLLLVGTPVLVIIVGVVTWRNARRALEPVHRIIAEVGAMGDGTPQARIALPGTDDEIGELATTMNAMLDRLDDFTERQRHFTADVSHELRSPLASLRTQLEVAVAHPDGVEISSLGTELLTDVGRLERLASGLLDLARLDHADTQHRAIDIRDVINDVLTSTATTRVTPCQVDLPSEPVMASADRRQLDRVVRNLLDNADRLRSPISSCDSDTWVIVAYSRSWMTDRALALTTGRGSSNGSRGSTTHAPQMMGAPVSVSP